MRFCIKYFMVALLCMFMTSRAEARDIKVSLPMLPPLVVSHDSGILVELLKAMAAEYKDGTISWDAHPFSRSIENVAKGRADMHMPLLVNPNIDQSKLPFQFSSERIFRVVFALYTNKNNNKEINRQNVANFRIETDMGHVKYFDFKVTGSAEIEDSLRRLDEGAIDGWIFAMPESDFAIKKLGLKNIKRQEYMTYDVRMILPKGEKGTVVDRILSDLIAKLKATGKYEQIMKPILDQKMEGM